MSSPGKVLLCDLLSDTLKTDPVTPQRTRQSHLERCCRYKAKTHTLALSKHAPLYFIIFLLNNIFKSKNRCRDVSHPLPHPPAPLLISPQTLAPLSWSASVGPARTTAISLAPCPWLCRWGETPPCPPSLCPLPSPRAIPPRAARTLSHAGEMFFLWRTCGKTQSSRLC